MKDVWKNMKKSLTVFKQAIMLLWSSSKVELTIMFLLSIITGLISTGNLLISKFFIDSLTDVLTLQVFGWKPLIWLFIILLISVFKTTIANISQYARENYTDKLNLYITDMIISKTVTLDMEKFDNDETYNKIQTAAQETPDRCALIIDIIQSLVVNVIQLIGVLGILLSFDGGIVLASFVTSIPLFLLSCYINEFWFKLFMGRVEKNRLADTLKQLILKNDNIKELKLFQISDFLKNIVLEQQNLFNIENRKNRKRFSIVNSSASFVNDLVLFLLKLWIILKAIKNKITIGSVMMLISAIDTFESSIVSILRQFSNAYEQLLYITYIFEIQKMKGEDDNNSIQIEQSIEKIEFRNVYFRYPGTQIDVLKDISFVMEVNKTYAMVGINGTGKTTLIKLLLKLYLPTSGTILINDIDIRKIRASSLRKQTTAVFQDFIKYPFSVYQNISVGDINREKDNEAVHEAAKCAGAIGFIENLSKGFDTQLQREWKDGIELSGGQWQKIAISRCFFRSSNVMILDEPFSSIDALSEHSIIEQLRIIRKNKICLFVTHRYTSIQLADQIIVMQNGTITEMGTHFELLSMDGFYTELIEAQTLTIEEE